MQRFRQGGRSPWQSSGRASVGAVADQRLGVVDQLLQQEVGWGSSSSLSASIFEMSRIWLMIASGWCAASAIFGKAHALFRFGSVAFDQDGVRPMMAFIGVRIS